MHSPYYRKRPDANIAFLFIHGILSSPRHFDWIIEQLPDKYEVKNLLLAGHGGGVTDFSRASMQQWQTQVEEALSSLQQPNRRIIIVGHSLGSLLALQAANNNGTISGLLLLNPPLRPRLKVSMLWRSIRFTFGKVKQDDPNEVACYNDMGITLDPYLWKYLGWIPNFVSLLLLATRCRSIPHTLRIPCFAYLGQQDEVVHPKSIRYLTDNPLISTTVFSDGTHFGFSSEHKILIQSQLYALINMIS